MKISKFFLLIAVTTAITLGYVHQQIELLKISYKMEVSEEDLTKLLDRNSFLVYNLIAIKAPHNLERILLAKNVAFELPATDQLMLINQPQFRSKTSGWERTKIAFANIFTFNSNAEARTINKNKW